MFISIDVRVEYETGNIYVIQFLKTNIKNISAFVIQHSASNVLCTVRLFLWSLPNH